MRRKLKRTLLIVFLSMLTLLSCGLGFASCSSKKGALQIVFKEQPYEYERGGVADAYDFIECQEGVDYTFAFSYLTASESGETVSTSVAEIKGSTIYLKDASRYTLYVTATRGEKSVSDSTEFDVIGETPVLLPPSLSQVYNIGTTRPVSILLDRAAPVIIPASCKLVVDYYTYQENQTPELSVVANTNEKVKTDLDVDDPDTMVSFDKRGLYEFHIIAYNGERTAEATFKVKVLPDQTVKVDGISDYKNAEFGENEDGSVDISTIRLVGSPDLAKASYVVLDDEYQAGQVARFEFYGKNMPSYLGLLNQNFDEEEYFGYRGDELPAGSNSLTDGGLGYCLTTEYPSAKGSVRLYGYSRKGTDTGSITYSSAQYPLEHWGFDQLEDDAHYFFEVALKTTGNLTQRPQKKKAWFVKGLTWLEERLWGDAEDDATSAAAKTQDISLNFSLYKVEDNGDYTIVGHSSTKHFEKGFLSWFLEGEDVKGKLVAYSSISKDITFKYYKDTLLDAEFDKDAYTYDRGTNVMSWAPVDGAQHYIIQTSDESSDRLVILDAETTSYNFSEIYERLNDFEWMTLRVCASIGNNTFSDKKYEYRLSKTPEAWGNTILVGELLGYNAEKEQIDISLNGGYYMNSSNYAKDVGYIAFSNPNAIDGTYVLDENGTYIDFYFTGNNMPNVEFFGSEISGNMFKDDKNVGFVVSNGNGPQHLYRNYEAIGGKNLWNKDLSNVYVEEDANSVLSYKPTGLKYNGVVNYDACFTYGVSYYNKFQQGTYASSVKTEDLNISYYKEGSNSWQLDYNVGYSKMSMYSLMQDETKNWHYVIGMFKGADGKVYLDAKLYEKNGNEETLFASAYTSVAISATKAALDKGETLSGYVSAYAALKGLKEYVGDRYYTKFTCSYPYSGANIEKPTALIGGGMMDVKANEVSLNGGYYMNGNNYSTDVGYLSFTNPNSADGRFTLNEKGTYLDFYFKGNNMPNVEFFGSAISGNMFTDGTNKGYVVTNGNAPQHLYRNYKEIMDNNLLNGDLAAAYVADGTHNVLSYNPTGLKYNGIVNYTAYFTYGVSDYNKLSQGIYAISERTHDLQLTYYNSTNGVWMQDFVTTYSDFSMYSLMQDESQEWHYVVGMRRDSLFNDVYVDAKLYKVNADGTETLFATYEDMVEENTAGERSGYITVYAALKGLSSYAGNNYYTKFTYTAPHAGNV